ncbi:MAG TPA: LysR family transcriptional regulator [Sphingobium sp.]
MDPDLALFARVVDAGSMSAAARNLGLSAAMVSKRIARLEARLGVRLLARTTRKLEPTARGQRFYSDIVAILETLGEAEARVTNRAVSPSGPLRVTAPTSFGRLHLLPHIKPFLDRYPDVELFLDLSDGFTDILRDSFDLAIRITSTPSPGLMVHRLAENRRVLCAAPDYLAERGEPVEPAALQGHRFLAAEGQSPWRLTGPDGQFSIDVESHVRTNSSEVVRELALAGVGIALRSLWDVSSDLAAGRLVRVLPQVMGSADAGIFAVHSRLSVPAGAVALLDHLRHIWTPAPPWEGLP